MAKLSDKEINSLLNRRVPLLSPQEIVNEIVEDFERELKTQVGEESFSELFPKGLCITDYQTRSMLETFCSRLIAEDPNSPNLKNKCRRTVLRSGKYQEWKDKVMDIVDSGEAEVNRPKPGPRRWKRGGQE